ncbi:MAG: hypothetical protein R2851_06925 [Caldilineaceae bacterium]
MLAERARWTTPSSAWLHGGHGFGLGGEVGAPPSLRPCLLAAAEAGLLSVPHAGETVGAASVWGGRGIWAHRIGHGVRAIEDPALLTLLKEQAIPLEVNPTSNICLHVYRRLAEHPLPHLDRMGFRRHREQRRSAALQHAAAG